MRLSKPIGCMNAKNGLAGFFLHLKPGSADSINHPGKKEEQKGCRQPGRNEAVPFSW